MVAPYDDGTVVDTFPYPNIMLRSFMLDVVVICSINENEIKRDEMEESTRCVDAVVALVNAEIVLDFPW